MSEYDTVSNVLCHATEPSTGRRCDLDRGHAGPHVSITEASTLAWAITFTADEAAAFIPPEDHR